MSFEHLYRPQHKSDKDIIADFVVRTGAFERIMNDIEKDGPGKHSQHHIVLGTRGMGKSTLFERIRVELHKPDLAKRFIAVKTAEENWPVNSLLDFWIWIGQYLANEDPKHYGPLGDLGSDWTQEDQYAQCFMMIEARLRANKQKLILLIDNVGEIFRKIKDEGNHALRETLVNNAWVKLIGGSAVHLSELETHSAPYFDLFKETRLEALTQSEVERMLLHYAKKHKRHVVERVVRKEPHRVDHLRILTGGVPRTIMLLLDVFAQEDGNGVFDDLRKTLDLVTPLYKHRMDEQSDQKQKITHALAMTWDGMSAKEIATATRLESKLVSSQLSQMVREGFVLKEETSTKNHFYQLAERFFNIWYLMNNAHRKGPDKVKWLTRFFELWCDKEGLKERALAHVRHLSTDKVEPRYSLLVANAMLASTLDMDTKELLYQSVRDTITKRFPQAVEDILPKEHWGAKSTPDDAPVKQAFDLMLRGDFKHALAKVDAEVPLENPWHSLIKGDVFQREGDIDKAKRYYLEAQSTALRLVRKDKTNIKANRDLSVSYYKLAHVALLEQNPRAARTANEAGQNISERLVELDARNVKALRDLASSHLRTGLLELSVENTVAATEAFERGRQFSQRLLEIEPSNEQALHDLWMSYQNLGRIAERDGHLKTARTWFASGVETSERLTTIKSVRATSYRELATSYSRLGNVAMKEMDLEAARSAFESRLSINKRLLKKTPRDKELQRDLSIAHYRIGDILLREGNPVGARKSFETGLALGKQLLKRSPSEERLQRDLRITYERLGMVAHLAKDEKASNRYFEASYELLLQVALASIKDWQAGNIVDAMNRFRDMASSALEIPEFITSFQLGLARRQYHGMRALFEVQTPSLKERYRPLYFALLYLMREEDPDSYKRMGKELEEPVMRLVKEVEELTRTLDKPSSEQVSKPKAKKKSARTKGK